jgi:hypothetical protein
MQGVVIFGFIILFYILGYMHNKGMNEPVSFKERENPKKELVSIPIEKKDVVLDKIGVNSYILKNQLDVRKFLIYMCSIIKDDDFSLIKYQTPSEFESAQRDLLCSFKGTYLNEALQKKDWEKFAEGYNGPAYARNNSHLKLKEYYNIYSQMEKVTLDR